ncbi:MAG: DUF255 domain-containing protein [Bacteroidales bacterium]
MTLKIISLVIILTNAIVLSAQEINWHTIEQAIELNKKEPRKIMVDIYTNWCGWCKVMDKNTFGNKIIAEYLNTKYYPVKLNAEQQEDITIGNTTYKYVAQGRGYHELAAVLLNGKMGYPSVVFMDEKLDVMQSFQGYLKPKQFDEISKFIGDDIYKTTTWEEFMKTYKSLVAEE